MKSFIPQLLVFLPALLPGAVVINEIHCDSLINSSKSEFVELFNDSAQPVDLSGWKFTSGIDFTFPAGTILPGGEALAVVENKADFAAAYGPGAGTGVIAHWHFDETDGTTAADTSGTLTAAGGVKTAVASGGVNQAAEGKFGGSGVAIDGAAGSFLTIPWLDALWGGSYTLAAWVKPADTSPNAILADIATPQSFLFSVDTLAKMTHRYNAATPATTAVWSGSGGTIAVDTWQHIAAVWDRDSQIGRLYLNGVPVYKAVVGKMPVELKMVQNARPWNIGRKQDNNECFNGLMDELWVIRGALTGASINVLMNENRIPATSVVDLADIVGGGQGSLPGTGGERGIDAATGLELPGLGAGDHTPAAPGSYFPVAHALIDGVFVPNGTLTEGQPVTSTGLVAVINSGDADPSPGHWLNGGGLLGDPSKVNNELGYYLPRYLDEPLTHSILSAMSQKGITFDLDAIEAAAGGKQVTAFTAIAADSRIQASGSVAALVLVDGVERFRQTAISNSEQFIDLTIPPTARFLTLVMTNSDGNNTNDHGYFSDPFLYLDAAPTAAAPRSVGPYAGSLSGNADNLTLLNATGTVVDKVDYTTEFPWPIAAGGEGPSMELIHPGLDNQLGGSWRSSAGAPTPGLKNSVFAANAPPQIRQVNHSPKVPPSGQSFTISAKVTDPGGVASVQLHYQVVLPGRYIPASLAKTPAQVIANPSTPRNPNPAFENPANWTTLTMGDAGINGDEVAGDTIYTAVIPAQINRTLLRYRLTAADPAGEAVRVPYQDDPSLNFAAYVYDGVPDYTAATRSVTGRIGYVHPKAVLTSLPVYSLLTDPADLVKCIAYNGADQINPSNAFESREAFNWDGAFVNDGVVHDHIRYRLRQRNDRYGGAGKRSFRFRFNRGHYAQFEDFEGNNYPEKWRTLNTHKGSARGGINMGLYEMANSYLWRIFGVPAPSFHWFHFRVVDGVDEAPAGVNGQHLGDFFGLLTGAEDYDSRFLSSRNMEPGNIYKLNSYILNGKEVQRYQAPNSVSDGSDFYNILYNLRAARSNDWLNAHVDYPAYYRYHAVVDAIRHYDVQPNITEHLKNRAWYFRPDAANPLGKMVTVPWDSDTSWGPNWNGGEDFSAAAALTPNKPDFVRDYRNTVREFRDLVWQRDQIEAMLNYLEARLAPFHLADRDRWTGAPAAAGAQTDGPLATRVADMKKFAFTGGTWEGGNDDPQATQSKDSGISGQQGRDAFLDFLQTDAAIPATPTLTYTGAAGFPANALTFASSAFSDPQGEGSFGAMEWRIAEYLPNAVQPDPEPIIPAKSIWKFNDTGTDLGTAWRSAGYDDSGWVSGPGELGYGETGLGTILTWGTDDFNRTPTYYFRNTFNLNNLNRFTGFQLGVRRDDGAVVYLNGVEVFRTGMPAAPTEIVYTTRASGDVTAANETTYFPFTLPLTALVEGQNTIAVEVHQFNATSLDLRFDLTLSGIYPVPPPPTELVWEYEHRWKSPLITPFTPTITIPSIAVRENRNYRTRVRHQDNTGRWSRWSAASAFTTSAPGIQPLLQHLAISEIMYDPAPANAAEALAGWTSQDFEWIELENRSSSLTLDLSEVRFTNGVNVDLAPGTSLTPGARCLVVRSRAAFTLRHGAGIPVAGEFSSSRLDNAGEPLKLSFGGGVPIREFRYDDDAPWPEGAKSTGCSISFVNGVSLSSQGDGLLWRAVPATPGATNVFPQGWNAWLKSNFDPADSDYALRSAAGADPDGDGAANMVEYVLGSSPGSAGSVGALEVSTIKVGDSSYVAISYIFRTDVTVKHEGSAQLGPWSPLTMTEVSRTALPDGSERVTLRESSPVSSHPARFLRLKISKP